MADKIQLVLEAVDKTGDAFRNVQNNLKGIERNINSFQSSISSAKIVITGMINKISYMSLQFWGLSYAAQHAIGAISAVFKPLYNSVEEYRMSVTQTAAMITSMMKPSGNLGEDFRQAKEYAEALNQEFEEIDAKTIASTKDIRIMNDEILKQGILLDTNNQKEKEAFTNIVNAVAVIAQGFQAREPQIRQEMRALIAGQVDARSQLASQVDAMLGGKLKERIAQWKEENTLIQNLGQSLRGYSAANKDIENTWNAIGSTMKTIRDMILRRGFEEAYNTINNLLKQANKYIEEHGDTLASKVHKGWLVIKGLVESVVNLFQPLTPMLSFIGDILGMIAKGLGLIEYVILPPLTDRIGKILDYMAQWVMLVSNLGIAFWKLLSLDFKGAAESAKAAKENFREAGSSIGQAFAGGFGSEVVKRYNEFEKIMSTKKKGIMEKPDISVKDRDIDKEKAKNAKDIASAMREWKEKIEMLNSELSDTDRKLLQLYNDAERLKQEVIQKGGGAKEIKEINEGLLKGSMEIYAKAEKERAEKEYKEYMKTQAEIVDKTEEFKRSITEAKATDNEKRFLEVEEWVSKEKEMLTELYGMGAIDYEVWKDREVEIAAIAAEKKKKIEKELLDETRKKLQEEYEAKLNYELVQIDLAEKERMMSGTEAIQEKIEKYEKYLDILRQNLDLIDKAKDTTSWYAQANAIVEITRKINEQKTILQEQTGTMTEGAIEGLHQVAKNVKTRFQEGVEIVTEASRAMSNAFSTFFIDIVQGKLKSLGDYVRGFLMNVSAIIMSVFSQRLVGQIASWTIGALGIGALGAGATTPTTTPTITPTIPMVMTAHSGGYIPRFHYGGLSSDEVPAILQRGEYVVSRHGVEMLDKINRGESFMPNVTVNVINKSSQPVNATQDNIKRQGKEFIVEVILEDIASNGQLAQAIKGVY